jgi:hypothetical protein
VQVHRDKDWRLQTEIEEDLSVILGHLINLLSDSWEKFYKANGQRNSKLDPSFPVKKKDLREIAPWEIFKIICRLDYGFSGANGRCIAE